MQTNITWIEKRDLLQMSPPETPFINPLQRPPSETLPDPKKSKRNEIPKIYLYTIFTGPVKHLGIRQDCIMYNLANSSWEDAKMNKVFIPVQQARCIGQKKCQTRQPHKDTRSHKPIEFKVNVIQGMWNPKSAIKNR